MEITDIDPLQNELLFERFLNPERVSMPDIDIDFCMNRRGEVIEYVTRKYGRDQVAQIITFNTMAAKAAIKDVGRALDMPYGEVDRIAKMVPPTIGITIEQALKDSPPLAGGLRSDPKIKELIDTALRLEGLVRGAGVHAAGVVIAPQPLTELVPVTPHQGRRNRHRVRHEGGREDGPAQDGLPRADHADRHRRLPEADQAQSAARRRHGDDAAGRCRRPTSRSSTGRSPPASSSLSRAACATCCAATSPTRVEDLTALNALYRPGPIQGGMIDDFIERKWGRRAVEYELPELEPLLKETLGVIVYQEQVMQISNVLARLLAGRSRPAAPRDGQERCRGDGQAARALHDGRGQRTSIPRTKRRRSST